jgi:hypothetical protein
MPISGWQGGWRWTICECKHWSARRRSTARKQEVGGKLAWQCDLRRRGQRQTIVLVGFHYAEDSPPETAHPN